MTPKITLDAFLSQLQPKLDDAFADKPEAEANAVRANVVEGVRRAFEDGAVIVSDGDTIESAAERMKEFAVALNDIGAQPNGLRKLADVCALIKSMREEPPGAGVEEEEIKAIGDAPAKHDRASDYEPTEPTTDELKRAGVTLLNTDSALVYLRCDHCGMQWAAPILAAPASWICPNTSDAERGFRFPVELNG